MKGVFGRLGRLLAVWAASLALGGAFLFGAPSASPMVAEHEVHPHRGPDGRPVRNARNQMISSNWSGYVLASYMTGSKYTGATARWTVPSVTAPSGFSAGYSSSWVGIGGFCLNSTCSKVDRSLIQLGTEQDASSSGATRYYAWYEMLPQYPVVISSLNIHPGDGITASLQLVGATRTGQVWQLSMTDQTTGQSWSSMVTYQSSLASAEWIEEAPYSGGILPLANFGTVVFDPGTVNGANPGFKDSEAIVMKNPNGQTSNASSPDADTDGFSACWGSGTFTTCPAPAS